MSIPALTVLSRPPEATLAALIAEAALRTRAAGQRWTAQRETIYRALLLADGAVGAYDLLALLRDRHGLNLQPASLYRGLDALRDLGVVVKIESINAWRACHHPHDDHQHVFLVCDGCGRTDEIADHGIAGQLSSTASARGFTTRRQVLELHGNCRTCTD